MVMNYLALVLAHLKWALDLLLFHPFYRIFESETSMIKGEVNICYYEPNPDSDEEVDCVVCLCKIREAEEIRSLRCEHLFHRGCLDRWVGFNDSFATCPLCRDLLGPRRAITEYGAEVLSFKFWSFSSGDRERWWLR